MADSAIGDLPSISTDLVSTDLFVLQRSGTAMKVSGQQLSDFMDRNVLAVTVTALASTDALTYSYDSVTGTLSIGIPVGQGIASIAKTSTSGLVDTYTVTRDDGTTVDTFTVTNGSSIQSIARTSGDGSPGSTDTYTVTLTNGNTTTFNVYNGMDGQGTVNSVNSISPDQNFNVTLTASNIDTDDSTSIQDRIDAIESSVSTLTTAAANKVLYLTSITVSATTGNIASVSDAAITADHVLAECIFADPGYITTNVTWTTAAGSLVLNGTCTTATTANVVLVKKDN